MRLQDTSTNLTNQPCYRPGEVRKCTGYSRKEEKEPTSLFHKLAHSNFSTSWGARKTMLINMMLILFYYQNQNQNHILLTFTKHIVQSISNKELQILDYKVYRFTYFTGTREVLLQLRVIKHELIKVNTDLRTSCSRAHIICKTILIRKAIKVVNLT